MRLRYNIYIYIYSFKQEGNDGKMMQLREEKVLFFSNQLFFFQIGNNYSINDAIEIGNIMYIYIYIFIYFYQLYSSKNFKNDMENTEM